MSVCVPRTKRTYAVCILRRQIRGIKKMPFFFPAENLVAVCILRAVCILQKMQLRSMQTARSIHTAKITNTQYANGVKYINAV